MSSSSSANVVKLTAKQQRRLALANLKSARSGRLSSALDGMDDVVDDRKNGDVYDVMDEEEYREYVERRREREDFVVDDGESLVVGVCRRCIASDCIALKLLHRIVFEAPFSRSLARCLPRSFRLWAATHTARLQLSGRPHKISVTLIFDIT